MRRSSIHLLTMPNRHQQSKNSKATEFNDGSEDASSIIDYSESSDIFYSYLNSPQQNFTSDMDVEIQPIENQLQSNTHLAICSQENISNVIGDQSDEQAFDQEFLQDMSMFGQPKQQQRSRKWNTKEDDLLIKYHKQLNGKWELIAQQITGRNASQCFQRWRRLFPPRKSKVQFNVKLDHMLKQLVQIHGHQWTKIAQEFPEFQPKQLRDRYINNLDESVNRDPFTPDEDQMILELYQIHGARWKAISKKLNNRTDNAVKNRFYGNLRTKHLGIQNPYQIVHKKI